MLTLQKEYFLIFVQYLQSYYSHVNESRYIVESITNNVFFIKCNMQQQGNSLFPRIQCGLDNDDFPILGFRQTQFSVRARSAVTTNEGQDQSFRGAIGLDRKHDFLAHRQL